MFNRHAKRHNKDETKITCPTFKEQELVIKDITNKINRSKYIEKKADLAQELQKEVEVLLSCSDFGGERLDCKNCHFIANLRKKTASLIIKAKKLA